MLLPAARALKNSPQQLGSHVRALAHYASDSKQLAYVLVANVANHEPAALWKIFKADVYSCRRQVHGRLNGFQRALRGRYSVIRSVKQ